MQIAKCKFSIVQLHFAICILHFAFCNFRPRLAPWRLCVRYSLAVAIAFMAALVSADVRAADNQLTDEEKAEHVEARVPRPVVEALLSTETEELDLVAAVHALAKHGDSQLVSVVSDDATVRVWVDGSPVGDKVESKKDESK